MRILVKMIKRIFTDCPELDRTQDVRQLEIMGL